ncbi:MAG TPA: TolC family outer membrane protein [Devosiaceae bacterium]|nr:TolC family outer membrane protein [Devosiaceae bacterium]
MSGANAESLKAALTAAYANNPAVRSALVSVKVAAETIALQKAATRPQVGAAASVTDAFGQSAGFGFNQQAASLGLNYSQTLFDSNKTNANVEQARAQVQVANQSLRSAEATVLLNAVSAYMNVILNTQLVKLRSDSVTFYQSQVKAAQDRENIGEGTKIDVAQAQASLASGIALQKAAIAALQTAQASYVQWVGHKPSNLSSDFDFGGLIPATVDRAVALANAYNPSILGASASIRAAQAALDAANSGFGPTVAVTGSLGPSFTSNVTTAVGDSMTVGGEVGLSVSVPIYAGGALGAATRQANNSLIVSQLNAQSAVLEINDLVVTSWSQLQNAVAQIESAKSAVDAGQLALEGVIQERDVGQKTTLDVLNQEATLETSQELLVTSNANKVIAAFSLVASTGRMSPIDLRLPTPVKSAVAYTQKVEDTWEEVRSFK